MKRQPEHEQIHRLSVKTLDQVFVAQAQEGRACLLDLFCRDALSRSLGF